MTPQPDLRWVSLAEHPRRRQIRRLFDWMRTEIFIVGFGGDVPIGTEGVNHSASHGRLRADGFVLFGRKKSLWVRWSLTASGRPLAVTVRRVVKPPPNELIDKHIACCQARLLAKAKHYMRYVNCIRIYPRGSTII